MLIEWLRTMCSQDESASSSSVPARNCSNGMNRRAASRPNQPATAVAIPRSVIARSDTTLYALPAATSE